MKYFSTFLLFFICFKMQAQDTTITVTPYPCDSVVTTTLPQVIYIYGYDTSIVAGTNFIAYYENQYYANLTGDVTVITPLYDTIPAHDTTFTCGGCGTCYLTDTVIIPEPPTGTVIYGMFPNNGTSFAARLDLTRQTNNTAFRDNFDAYQSTWKVEEVHDEPLMDLMTYNAPPCCHLNYFPTGTELTRQLNALDSTLTVNADNLPELISFNNEEPNVGYWQGTPQSYLDWMNAATTVAHAHGVPVSNGGVLQNIIWYVRWVYEQEGNTDTVNLINSMTGYGTNTLAFQQRVIDWYKVEIPGIAASAIDYVNFHWYEPTSLRSPGWETPESITEASGLLPIMISFLRSHTGKPVITTEFGTGNDSQNLLNEVADQIKDSGVPIMIYYAGEGPLANYHPDWWEAWIIQQGAP